MAIAAAPRGAPWCLVVVVLLATAAGGSRTLQQGGCPDLVPGGVGAVVQVAAGGSDTVLAFENVGPIYLAGSAEDADDSQGPSQYSFELWNAAGDTLGAGAASAGAAGCATTPVVDFCASGGGPEAVLVRVACLNGDGRPCRVRVAAYMSPCPGGPALEAVAVSGGDTGGTGGSSGGSSSGGDSSGQAGGSLEPGDPEALTDGSRGMPIGSGSEDSSGTSPTTWIIVGVAVGAALLAVLIIWLCVRRCRRRRRAAADLESGGYKPPQQQQQQQHQPQFLVSNGSGPARPWQQPGPSPTKPAVPPPAGYPAPPVGAVLVPPRPPAAGAAAATAAVGPAAPPPGLPFQQAWAFGYKVPARRDVMATDASKRSGSVLQHCPDVDSWLAAVVTAGRRWEGCIMYNDDPPEAFPDGTPTGYMRPAPYRLCGHCKGVVVWDRRWCGWLVHSLPCWPCHDRSAPSGCATLSSVQPQQTDRGQSFLWVLLPVQALPEVLMQIMHMQAFVYFRSDPRVWPHAPRDYTKATGRGFRLALLGPGLWHLAKANEPNENYYREVAARFGGRWLVRTNLRGEPEPSSHSVRNIGELHVPGWDHAPYKAGSEHAKMAVAVGSREGDRPQLPLVLVGDCNNTVPSHKRGGGGIIVQHPHFSEILRLMAREYGTP